VHLGKAGGTVTAGEPSLPLSAGLIPTLPPRQSWLGLSEQFVAFRSELPDYMVDRPKIRMPEGIGIHDKIFKALAELTPAGHIETASVTIDSQQVHNALSHYLELGFDLPTERYKKIGMDYFQGGYFAFGAV